MLSNSEIRNLAASVVQNHSQRVITTTDATPVAIASLDLTAFESGIIWAMVAGIDAAGNSIFGIKQARYKAVGGEVSFGAISEPMGMEVDEGLAGAGFSFNYDGSLVIEVTGLEGVVINWSATYYITRAVGQEVT